MDAKKKIDELVQIPHAKAYMEAAALARDELKDDVLSFSLLQAALELGDDPEVYYYLHKYAYLGIGCEENKTLALGYLHLGITKKSLGCLLLATQYLKDGIVKEDDSINKVNLSLSLLSHPRWEELPYESRKDLMNYLSVIE